MSAMPPNNNPFLNASVPPPAADPLAAPTPALQPAQPPIPPPPKPFIPAPPRIVHSEQSSIAAVKDTIEAIIIALILALTFRAFMVEAFVIPTGSMAPTLLGAHYRVTCPQCGYEFDESADVNRQIKEVGEEVTDDSGQKHIEKRLKINYLREGTLDNNTSLPAEDYRTCPNCGYHIHATQLADKAPPAQFSRDVDKQNMYFPWANNGDRILVMKYQYAIFRPRRWDVIVFKEPQQGQQNYIKRLTGLPGETLEIIGGDLYAGKPVDGKLVLHIQRKPNEVQRGMWQLVYNNDFYPIDAGKPRDYEGVGTAPAWTNPWVGDVPASWDTGGPLITCRSPAPATLDFHQRDFYMYNVCGFNPPDFNRLEKYAPNALRLNDIAGANGYGQQTIDWANSHPNPSTHNLVGDLHLETLWTPASRNAAAIQMTLGLPSNCFRCGIAADGTVALEKLDPVGGGFTTVPSGAAGLTVQASANLEPTRPVKVAMDNCDHAVHFWVDGQELLDYEPDWTDADGHRWVKQLQASPAPPIASIHVGGACTMGHLKLMRDVYYTNSAISENGDPYPALRAVDGSPVTLLDDEFFAMGDNSNFSSDGRLWRYIDARLSDLPGFKEDGNMHAGRVPRRYLLGKAFFVYWPAGFRPMDNVPVPLVPDTGHMRIIR
jgi:signal peptidase I